jgi:hypothetical protein
MADVPRIPSMAGPRIPPPTPPLPQTNVEGRNTGPRPVGGMNPDMKMLQSLDGFVDSVTAAAYEIREAVKQLKVVNDRTEKYYASSTGSTATAGAGGFSMPLLSQMMGNVVSQTFTSMGFNIAGPQLQQILHQSGPQQEHFAHIQNAPGVAEVQHQRNRESQARRRADARTATSPDQLPPHETGDYQDPTLGEGHYGSLERYRRGREAAPHSIGELRQRAIGYAQQQIQKRMTGSGQRQLGKILGEGGGDMMPVGADMGGFTAEQAASSLGQTGVLGRAGSMVGALGEEGGMGALASVLPEAAAGPVGWAAAAGTVAWEGIQRGAAFAQQQRAENSRFQAIMGGSNIAGFGQRAQQAGFRYGQMGTLSGEQANQLFYGVTETGLRGGERQQGLDFAVREYKNLGMTIEDSLHIINVAAQSGKTNFDDLAVTLNSVSDSAAKAGVNTEKARRSFVSTYETLVGGFGAQGGAATLAGAVSSGFTGNRLTQDVQGGGIFQNPGVLAMAAAQHGLTPGQFQGMIRSPNAAVQRQVAGVVGDQYKFAATSALGPDGQAAVLRIVGEVGGKRGQRLTPEQYNLVISRAYQDPAIQGSMASWPGGVQQVLQQMAGINAPDENKAWITLIDIINGANDTKAQATRGQQAQHSAALGAHGAFSGGGVFGQSGMLSTGSLLSHVPGGGGIQRAGHELFGLTTGTTVGDALGHIPVVGGALGWVEKHTNPFFYGRSLASHLPGVGGFFSKPSGKQGAQAAYSELAARHPDVFKGAQGEQTQAELDWMVSQHGGENVHWTDDKGKVHTMSQAGFIKQHGSDPNMIGKARVGKTGVSLNDLMKSGGLTGTDDKDGKGGDQHVKATVTISAKPALQRWLDFQASGNNAPTPAQGNLPPSNQTLSGYGPSGQP